MKLNYVKPKLLRPLALSIAALLASAPAAFALDANDFASKFSAMYAPSMPTGMALKFGNGKVDGTNITFDSVGVTSPDGSSTTPFYGQVTFTGVTEGADGSYTADMLTTPDNDIKPDATTEVTIKNVAFKHIFVPGGKSPSILDASKWFTDFSAGPIAITSDGKTAVTLDSISVSNSFKPTQSDPNTAEVDSTGGTNGLKIDMTQAKDADSIAQAKALGLETITGKGQEALSWTLNDGHFNLSEVSVSIDKVGKIKFALDLTGYTLPFASAINTAIKSMAGPDSPEKNQQMAAVLGMAQTLFLNSTSLRYDDDGITAKVLDMAATQSGADKGALIAQLVAMIPGEMMSGGSASVTPDEIKMVQAAGRAFLTDPHSVEVRVAPKAPLGILGLIAAAMAPANLADTIGLKVLVNDKEITQADAAKETGVPLPGSTGTTDTPATTDNSSSSDNSGAATDNSSSDNSNAASTDNSSSDNSAASSDNSDNSSGARLSSTHKH